MKSRFIAMAAGLLVGVLMVSQGYAFSLPANTNVEIKYSNWEMLVDRDNSGGFSVGDEVWGLLRVTSINDAANNPLWNPLSSNEEITGMFEGLVVTNVDQLATDKFSVQFSGGTLDLFLHEPSGAAPDPTNFASFIAGQHLLATEFNYGILPSNTDVDMNMDVNRLTSPLSGTNSFYLDVIGGDASALFDSNTWEVFDGSRRDILGMGHITSGNFGFDFSSNTNLEAFPVPEPSTFLLLGAGLFGVGLFGRKRVKA